MVSKRHILLTTSRRPTENMRTLCRDLSHTFPFVVRVNRGKMSLEEVAGKALEFDAEKVVIIDRWKQGFGRMEFFYVKQHGLEGVPPILCICDAKFRRDFGEAMPRERRIRFIALATTRKRAAAIEKLEKFLSNFFGIPILSFEETKSGKYDAAAQILSAPFKTLTLTFRLLPELVEIGPRIGISDVVWEFRR